MVSSYMGRPILYAHLIWNHFTAAFLRYGTLFDLEGYKDTISNKYKTWIVSSYMGRPILYEHSPEHSLSPFLAGGMIFPPPSGILDPCQFSSNNWKLISFNSTWLYKKNKNLSLFQNLHLSLYLSLHPLLACTYLNNAWDLVLLALPLYVCLFKINRFMYSPIVSRFG